MSKFYRAAPVERTITLSIRLDCDNNVVGHVIGSNFAHTSANPAIALDVLQSVVRAYLSLMIDGSARLNSPVTGGSPTSGLRFIFKEDCQ